MIQLKWQYSLAILICLATLVMFLMIGLQHYSAKQNRAKVVNELQSTPSAKFSMEEIPNYQFIKSEIDEYSEFVERPLFFKGRRPIIITETKTETEKKTTKPPVKLGYTLIGMVEIPNKSYALFKNAKSKNKENKFIRVSPGDVFEGWELTKIESDHVVISNQSSEEKINLLKPRKKYKSALKKGKKQTGKKAINKLKKSKAAEKAANSFQQKSNSL